MTTASTEYFFNLDPDTVLRAVEETPVTATGKILALNSFENRVYQVEIEVEPDALTSPYDAFRVAKFYRPGRWSEEQIREEHAFLKLLTEHEVPVVAPLPFPDGGTLQKLDEANLWFCIYQKVGGRHRAELPESELRTVGRLLAQVHNVGTQLPGRSRLTLTAELYGLQNMEYLCESNFLPEESKPAYRSVVEPIVQYAALQLKETQSIRLHGDCHLGNVLWLENRPFILDFDDMVYGPAVQDIWLLNPGRDDDSRKRQEILLEGYSELRSFPLEQLNLIELLRALRILHFQSWIAKRWNDPIFPRTFEQFGTAQYWREELSALQEISDIIFS